MTRYVTSTSAPSTSSDWWEAKATDFLARTIHQDGDQPIDTGLMDASGRKLFRVEDRRPIGFIHPKG